MSLLSSASTASTDQPVTDCFFNPIGPGDFITYSAQYGNSPILRVGKILRISKNKTTTIRVFYVDGYALYRRTPITEAYTQDQFVQFYTGESSVAHFDKVLKIDPSMVPAKIMEIFNSVDV